MPPRVTLRQVQCRLESFLEFQTLLLLSYHYVFLIIFTPHIPRTDRLIINIFPSSVSAKITYMVLKLRKYFSFLAVNLEAGDYLENFMVSAVFSIVVIRVFLAATGYPQLGGGGLHIAHMLWGGFLMMAAIIILLSFLSKQAKYVASILGGLGFGVFIDELGKFITHDNNYFFKPVFALIYIIFVLMFLGIRAIEKSMKVLEKDYTINALEVIKEVVLHDLDASEKKHALAYLEKGNEEDLVVRRLRELLMSEETIESNDISISTKVRRLLQEKYIKFIRQKRFAKKVSNFFVAYAIIGLVVIVYYYSVFYGGNIHLNMNFWDWGLLLSPIVSGIFVLLGFSYRKGKGNIYAYSKYKQAVLITIFIGQFFLFYKLQLVALFGLIININVLIALQFLISQEILVQNK